MNRILDSRTTVERLKDSTMKKNCWLGRDVTYTSEPTLTYSRRVHVRNGKLLRARCVATVSGRWIGVVGEGCARDAWGCAGSRLSLVSWPRALLAGSLFFSFVREASECVKPA